MSNRIWKTGTVTFCWDFCPGTQSPAGTHVNRWGRRVRSARAWWKWFAVAAYRMDDRDLVAYRHAWSEERDHLG